MKKRTVTVEKVIRSLYKSLCIELLKNKLIKSPFQCAISSIDLSENGLGGYILLASDIDEDMWIYTHPLHYAPNKIKSSLMNTLRGEWSGELDIKRISDKLKEKGLFKRPLVVEDYIIKCIDSSDLFHFEGLMSNGLYHSQTNYEDGWKLPSAIENIWFNMDENACYLCLFFVCEKDKIDNIYAFNLFYSKNEETDIVEVVNKFCANIRSNKIFLLNNLTKQYRENIKEVLRKSINNNLNDELAEKVKGKINEIKKMVVHDDTKHTSLSNLLETIENGNYSQETLNKILCLLGTNAVATDDIISECHGLCN